VHYNWGSGAGGPDSSARINAIEDPRGSSQSFPSTSYQFTFNSDAIPHLTGIANYMWTGEAYTLWYLSNQALSDPFSSSSFGTTTLLQAVQTNGLNIAYSFGYQQGSGEMTQMSTPLGGVLQWQYQTYTYSGPRNYREVRTRYMQALSGGTQYQWNIQPHSNTVLHGSTTVSDLGAGTSKVWTFRTDVGAFGGYASAYEEATLRVRRYCIRTTHGRRMEWGTCTWVP